MAFDHHRRSSASPAPPPAPPLPPQRYSDVAKTVLERLRLGVRKSPSNQSAADDLRDELIYSPKFGPSTSQSSSHKTGLKLRALDGNKDKTHVVLAGGKVLKTLRLEGTSCIEDFDLRAVALNYWDINPENIPPPKRREYSTVEDVSSIQRATFDIEDVAWSNGQYDRIIATAVSNGNIILYDLERPGVVARHLREHHRQVHKVDFNPIEGKCLLSGSQDGTVILWDLRSDRGNALTATNGGIYDGRSDGVRHVKWSPVDTWAFAFGTDGGAIQRWDTRQLKSPLWKVLGHSGICNSVDWHPDGKHLVSASKDKNVRVWDVTPDSRKRKPVVELRAPYEVQNVRWRPPCLVSDRSSNTSKQCTNLATSYKGQPVAHIWDLRRPYMPFMEVHHQLNTGTNDMMWRSRDLLWTVGPGGEFTQTDVQYTPRTLAWRPLQAIANGPDGELGFFTTSRPTPSPVEENYRLNADSTSSREKNHQDAYFSRSPGDDSVAENFLSSSYRSRTHSRTPSMKSTQSLGMTPPTAEDQARPIVPLDQTLKIFKASHGLQASKHGSMPGSNSAALFAFFAHEYKSQPLPIKSAIGFLENVQALFERNATNCRKASRYRDAQTWKIFGAQVIKDLHRRAFENRRRRLKVQPPRPVQQRRSFQKLPVDAAPIPRFGKDSEQLQGGVNARIGQQTIETKATSTSSNLATPVARPMNGPDQQALIEESLSLDEVKAIRQPLIATDSNLPNHSNLSEVPDRATGMLAVTEAQSIDWNSATVEGDERRAMVNQWRVQPKLPLNLEEPLERSNIIAIPGRLDRQDSSDSIPLFSTSSGSRPKLSAAPSFVSGESSGPSHNRQTFRDRLKNDSSFLSSRSDITGSSGANSDQNFTDLHESIESSEPKSVSESLQFSSPDDGRAPKKYQLGQDAGTEFTDVSTEAMSSQKLIKQDAPSLEHPGSPSPGKLCESQRTDSDPAMDHVDNVDPVSRMKDPGSKSGDLISLEANGSTTGSVQKPNFKALPPRRDTDMTDEQLVRTDYLTACPKRDEEDRFSIDAIDMLQRLLAWYSEHADAQTASHLFLLSGPILAPLVDNAQEPGNKTVPKPAYPTVAHGTDVSQLGISPLWAEALLSTYYEQLMALKLFNAAADLRRLSYPCFPGVYEQGLKDVEIGTLCLECRKPINNPRSKLICETCDTRQANCPICWSKESPYGPTPTTNEKRKHAKLDDIALSPQNEDSYTTSTVTPGDAAKATRLWSFCALCNHGGHAACAQAWFTEGGGEGACPVSGCLCACVNGLYRQEKLAKLESLEWVKGRRKAGIRRDDWHVGESSAAGRARGVLWGRVSATGSGAGDGGNVETERNSEEGRRVRINVPNGKGKARGRSR